MRYLGIDYGLRKVGLAISEGQLASIYKVIEIHGSNDAIFKIKKIVQEEKIDRIVIGVPEGRTGKIVKKFVKRLSKDLIVIEADETLSSVNAKRLMIDLNLSSKMRRMEDAYSAALILQNFLDTLE